MSYVVLARKWRPKFFEEVVGQEHVARTLVNAIAQKRVAHAYLFCGTRGVGKTTTARILAKALNCAQGPTPTPCYECSSCKEILEGQAVDVFEIDGASNRGINEIRELREGVRYAPSRDRYKVYIIDEVHMLTNEAFNALLKTLEEPPAHAHFIFATTEPQKIPVTILSRCQRFDFKRIGQNDIVAHLTHLSRAEEIDAEKAALQLIARQANGGMRDALSLMDQVISFAGDSFDEAQVAQILGVANRKHLFELSQAVINRDAEAALLVLDEINRYGYDLQQFSAELVTHFRDLVVTAVVKNPERVTNLTENELAHVTQQVEGQPVELLHRYFAAMADGAQQMLRSAYPRLVFEMTLVRLAQLEPLDSLDLMVDRLRLLENTLEADDTIDLEEATAAAPKKKITRPPVEPSPAQTSPALAEAPPATNHSDFPAAAPKIEEPAPEQENPAPRIENPAPAQKKPAPSPLNHDGGEPAAPQRVDEISAQESPATPAHKETETDQISAPEYAPAARAELMKLAPRERWRHLVAHLRQSAKPVAATCDYAHLQTFEDDTLHIGLSSSYMALFEKSSGPQKLEAALHELFGSAWTLKIDVQQDLEERSAETGESAQTLTLAAERDAALAKRREDLKEALITHPTVERARALFEVATERSAVELHD